jgi:hypothetical protein
VISLSTRVEPNVLSQYQQLNSTTLSGMVMPPNTLGDGLAFLEEKLAEIAPQGFRSGYTGTSRRYVQESATFPLLFGLSLLLIFLVLAAQFNSFRDPLVVLVAVPLSIFGAMVPIAVGVMTLNIYTQIGLLTLIGLIAKHGILIVEFANQLALQGRAMTRCCRGRDAAPAPDPHDDLRHGARRAAAADCQRTGRQRALLHRHDDHRGHAGRHAVHPVRAADLLPALRRAAKRREAERSDLGARPGRTSTGSPAGA